MPDEAVITPAAPEAPVVDTPSEQPAADAVLDELTPAQISEWRSGKTKTADLLLKGADSAPAEASETRPDSEPGKNQQEAGDKKPATGFDKRKQELTNEIKSDLQRRNELRVELQQLEAARERLKQPGDTRTPPSETAVEPDIEQFETVAEFVKAHSKWAVAESMKALQAEQQRTAVERTAAEKHQAAARNWNERQVAYEAEHPDYQEALQNAADAEGPSADTAAMFMFRSEVGPAMAHHFALNPGELSLIAKAEDQTAAFKALTRLEMMLMAKPSKAPESSPPVKQQSKAPPPPSPLPGRSTTAADPIREAMLAGDDELYARLKNEAEIKRRFMLT